MPVPQNVYIIYWGWQGDPSNEAPVLENFFSHVGGTDWLNTVTQYYDPGYCRQWSGTECIGPTYPGNPPNILKGTYSDPSTPPVWTSATNNDFFLNALPQEAVRMAAQFGDPNGIYVLAFPQGSPNGTYCGSHGHGPESPGTRAFYIWIPYETDGTSCGNSLDNVSWAAGHELAETITDPVPYTGWVGPASEIGDECQGYLANVSLSGATFLMQALWSNATNSSDPGVACIFSSPLYGY